MKNLITSVWALVIAGFILQGCERASEEDINPDNPLGPNLTSLQANVFDLNCALSGCHAGSNPPQDLNLETGRSFSELVNVPSEGVPVLLRVRPGDPDQSYLYLKVIGDPSIVGSSMPLGRPPLSDEEVEALRLWIANGAPEN